MRKQFAKLAQQENISTVVLLRIDIAIQCDIVDFIEGVK
jgi:hypothetical protein